LLPDGSYDLNFMGTGVSFVYYDQYVCGATCGVLQDDQKLVIGGYAGEFIYGMTEFAISRIDTLGFLDLSFGTNGYVITNLGVTGTFYASILDIILQSDGKIVALGDLFESPRRSLVLLRYLSNGQPDSTFGVNGVTKLGMDSTYFSAVNILQQADGKFLVHTVKSPGNDVYLLRFNLDGSLDTTYQNAGLAPLDINNYYFDMTMLSDGSLFLLGIRLKIK
jgi:uncharacterized delta-60 repeat protein